MKVLERARGAERWGGCGAMGPGLWAAVLALGLGLEAAWAQPIFPSITNRPFIRECVRVHNEFRRQVVPSASNMRQMVGKSPGQARLAFSRRLPSSGRRVCRRLEVCRVGAGWAVPGGEGEPPPLRLDRVLLGRVKQNRRC